MFWFTGYCLEQHENNIFHPKNNCPHKDEKFDYLANNKIK